MPSVFKNLRKTFTKSSEGRSSKRKSSSSTAALGAGKDTNNINDDAALASPQTTDTSSIAKGSASTNSSQSIPHGSALNTQQSFDSVSSAGRSATSGNRRSMFPLDIAKQAVDQIVSRATISVDSVNVRDLTSDGFHVSLHIHVAKTGPAKAKITFPDGLDLYLHPTDTVKTANIRLSPIKIRTANRQSGLTVDGLLTARPRHTASRGLDDLFHTLLASTGDVVLRAASENTEVKAYGMSFKRIALEKQIVIQGLNNLGGVLSFDPPPSAPSSSVAAQRSSIQDFQILGGDPTAGISFQANVELNNPAEITAQIGDVRLNLQTDIDELRADGKDQNAMIGHVILPDLLLKPGSSSVVIRGNVLVAPQDDSARTAGITLIRFLLENRSISVNVVGSDTSSDIPWVAALFKNVRISALLPALGISSKLLDGASLVPAEEMGPAPQSQLCARATLRNQLGPPLHIHSLKVRAFQDVPEPTSKIPSAAASDIEPIHLGDISTPPDWPVLTLSSDNPVHASLPFSLSGGGASYVRILQTEAKRKGIQLNRQLVAALRLMPTSDGQQMAASEALQSPSRGKEEQNEALDLPNVVASALSSLKVSAHVSANVSIGDFRIPGEIEFVQNQLPIAITVKTARTILPTVGAPLVDALIDQARVSITRLKILDMDEKGLNIEADIGLVDFGPLDVEIHFDQGLDIVPRTDVHSEETVDSIARIVFAEPVRGVAGSEELLKTRLRILPTVGPKSVAKFATFVSQLVQADELPIRISSDACRVVAGGAEFPAVLTKAVSLPGLGGLTGMTLNGLDIYDEVAAPAGPGRGRALSSSSSSSGGSSYLVGKEKAFRMRTRVRIPHKGLLAVALAKIEAGVVFEGVQIGIISAEDIVFSLNAADVEFEANGYIFVGSESIKEKQPVAEYRIAALQTFGKLATALLSGTPAELTVTGYRAFAMGEVQLGSLSRNQMPSQLLSRPSASSMRRASSTSTQKQETKLPRAGSLKTSSSATFTQRQVPWLDQAFQQVSIKTVLQQSVHPVIKDMQIEKIFASFRRQEAMQAEIDKLAFHIEVPLSVRFEVISIQADIEVHYDGYGCVGTGKIDANVQSCTPMEASNGDGGDDAVGRSSCLVRLAPGSFKLVTPPTEGLAQLVAHIADSEQTNKISIRGKARARVEVALGEIFVDVDLGKQPHVLHMDGVRGLRSSPVQYTNLQVVEASSDFLKIVFSLYLNNPSKTLQVALPDTDLTMAAFYKGSYVGRAHIPKGFKLESGPVAVHDIHFRYCPPPEVEKEVRDIPANLLSGRTTTLEIRGDDESSEIPMLIPALKNIHLSFDLKPMMDRTLIDSISITLGVSALTSASVDAEFVVNNPLGVPFDLVAMSFMASYQGQPFGSCTITYASEHPLRVPAGSVKQPGQQRSSPVTVTLAQPLESMVGAFLKSKGQIMLDLEVAARVEIQGFKIPNFNYRQPSLPLSIKGLDGISKWMKFLP
ncbi:hypothetical protein PHSY_002287 [Pseudozyma hubeiensis SY62]|uniref:Uncharacterized protein n=1 Tax=Pseudozyma hubeiensis (strain SY62) TaxID=1305764 RepID=R9P0R4_PSEHS|nr:hypothetical protein PHSY_002287 [Pseudozyma hubeiensis SY62]GAC94714.1 hypothetical protein PHSY_002287 [Pseudozyma hubeiensis SY62]